MKTDLRYTCTDPDCAQYAAKFSDTRYGYIECRQWGDKYIVCHAVVDLRDYSMDEVNEYCASYYDSLEKTIYDYGLRDALRVMTECIFEQIPLSQMEFTAERPTEEAAREFIHEWVQNDGVW